MSDNYSRSRVSEHGTRISVVGNHVRGHVRGIVTLPARIIIPVSVSMSTAAQESCLGGGWYPHLPAIFSQTPAARETQRQEDMGPKCAHACINTPDATNGPVFSFVLTV